jgi:hypothetical protein
MTIELKNKKNKLTERAVKEAVWVDQDIHQLLWKYKVENSKRSIGDIAGHFIKLGICEAESQKK